MIKVAILGIAGSMGRASAKAILDDDVLELSCGVDPKYKGDGVSAIAELGSEEITIHDSIERINQVDIDVCLDFTNAQSAYSNALFCAQNAINIVIGTSGLDEERVQTLRVAFEKSSSKCLVVPNFALGAVLMMRFAQIASQWMDRAEIIELHHDRKLDSPSGTSIATARGMGNKTGQDGKQEGFESQSQPSILELQGSNSIETIEGARGALGPNSVRIHSVRLPGLLAHQEVILSSLGESLTIRHDSYDRSSFMPGVLLALKSVSNLESSLTVGIDSLLGL